MELPETVSNPELSLIDPAPELDLRLAPPAPLRLRPPFKLLLQQRGLDQLALVGDREPWYRRLWAQLRGPAEA